MKLNLLALALLFAPSLSFAQCPDWVKSKASSLPLCPEGTGATLVPETFPTAAVLLSDRGERKDSKFTADVVEKVLQAAPENPPMILLAAGDDTLKVVQERIESMSGSAKDKQKRKAALVQIFNQGYAWQQDYMQPYVNPLTGQIIFREVEDYNRSGILYSKLTEATKACGFEEGAPLKADKIVKVENGIKTEEVPWGAYGGNIEALPGGICLLGTDSFVGDQYAKYAEQACGSHAADKIKVPTSWLKVGHTDEVVKVVRNKKRKSPCDFSVLIASPAKARSVLAKAPDAKFLDFQPVPGVSSKDVSLRRIREVDGLAQLCKLVKSRSVIDDVPSGSKPNDGVSRRIHLRDSFIQPAFASEAAAANGLLENGPASESCAEMTNRDVHRMLTEDTPLKKYNDLVQAEMAKLKTDIQTQLEKKLSKCKVDFIDVPGVFSGGEVVEGSNGPELPNGMGRSLLPNPTNGISIHDTVIFPEPANSAFKADIVSQLNEREVKTDFVDNFDIGHRGGGNLHCATNTIHACRPRGKP